MTDVPLYRLFHENSKLSAWEWDVLLRVQFVNESGPFSIGDRPGLDITTMARLELPRPTELSGVSVGEAFARRRSADAIDRGGLGLTELSCLLHVGAGLNGAIEADGRPVRPLRSYPSPGGLYPNIAVVECWNVHQVPRGVHFYDPMSHQLGLIERGDVEAVSRAVSLNGTDNCAVRIWIVCAFERVAFKYGERGYRFALLEAGHIAQNLLLAAAALNLPARPYGGFFDDDVQAGLGLGWADLSPVYAVAIGGSDA